MTATTAPAALPTIRNVLAEFLLDRIRETGEERGYLYRRVLLFLELCINDYGHRNLKGEERDLCERVFRSELEPKYFFEVFGPATLLPELDFFAETYLERDVCTSERVIDEAPTVVAELRNWLVEEGHVSEGSLREAAQQVDRRRRFRTRVRKAAREMREFTVSVDGASLSRSDYIEADYHVISRLEPCRLWLRVYRSPEAEIVGPVAVPPSVMETLRVGWSLRCALAFVRGRWHLARVEEVYPRD